MLVILSYRHEGEQCSEKIELSAVPDRGMQVPIAGRARQVSRVDWMISETVLEEGEMPHAVVKLHD